MQEQERRTLTFICHGAGRAAGRTPQAQGQQRRDRREQRHLPGRQPRQLLVHPCGRALLAGLRAQQPGREMRLDSGVERRQGAAHRRRRRLHRLLGRVQGSCKGRANRVWKVRGGLPGAREAQR